MIRDITIGQYYPADSVLHKMDPRVRPFAVPAQDNHAPSSFYHMLSVIYLLIIARTIVLVQIDFLFQFVLNHDIL